MNVLWVGNKAAGSHQVPSPCAVILPRKTPIRQPQSGLVTNANSIPLIEFRP